MFETIEQWGEQNLHDLKQIVADTFQGDSPEVHRLTLTEVKGVDGEWGDDGSFLVDARFDVHAEFETAPGDPETRGPGSEPGWSVGLAVIFNADGTVQDVYGAPV